MTTDLAQADSLPDRLGRLTPLHVVPELVATDVTAAEGAAGDFPAALGVDTGSASMTDTPRRMAQAYAEMPTPRSFELSTFPNDEGFDELVVACGMPMQSISEHHMLPFLGVALVGYLPGNRILGLSKLAWSRGRAPVHDSARRT